MKADITLYTNGVATWSKSGMDAKEAAGLATAMTMNDDGTKGSCEWTGTMPNEWTHYWYSNVMRTLGAHVTNYHE